MGCGTRRFGNSTEGFVAHAQKMAGLFAICIVIWAATGFGGFWPGWVLLFGGLSLGNHARRVYGGRRDDELDTRYDPDFDSEYERL